MGCDEEMDIDFEYYDRMNKLRDRLSKMPISNFEIGDLPSILRIIGFEEGGFASDGPFYEDLELLEKRLPQIQTQEPHVVFNAES